jgi:hypothetical protein
MNCVDTLFSRVVHARDLLTLFHDVLCDPFRDRQKPEIQRPARLIC